MKYCKNRVYLILLPLFLMSTYANSLEFYKDPKTGLEWQKHIEPIGGLTDKPELRTWLDAKTFCGNANDDDDKRRWRLPNFNELITIIDFDLEVENNAVYIIPELDSPAFANLAFKQDGVSSEVHIQFWSSTTVGFNNQVYVVGYGGRYVEENSNRIKRLRRPVASLNHKVLLALTRCVRNGWVGR